MNANHVRELGQATVSGSLPFPDIVGKLIAEGVEYYHVDYVALHINFYSTEGAVVIVPLNFENLPQVAPNFDSSALISAILDSQKNNQKFRDFSRRSTQHEYHHRQPACPSPIRLSHRELSPHKFAPMLDAH